LLMGGVTAYAIAVLRPASDRRIQKTQTEEEKRARSTLISVVKAIQALGLVGIGFAIWGVVQFPDAVPSTIAYYWGFSCAILLCCSAMLFMMGRRPRGSAVADSASAGVQTKSTEAEHALQIQVSPRAPTQTLSVADVVVPTYG